MSGASHDGAQVGGAGAHVSQAVVPHEGVTLLLHRIFHLNRVRQKLKAIKRRVDVAEWLARLTARQDVCG